MIGIKEDKQKMTKNDYDQLLRQLYNLELESPCQNGACVGCQNCEYSINGCYGDECAIDVIRREAVIKCYLHLEKDQ